MPNKEDLEGAVDSIVRLEETFLIPPSDMRKGIFGRSQSFRYLNGLFSFNYSMISVQIKSRKDKYLIIIKT